MSQASQQAPRALIEKLGQRLERRGGTHLYRQFQNLLRDDITSGQLRPGDSLPPQREISQLIGISEVTIRRALQELAEEGLLEARAGSGTIVLDGGLPKGRHAANNRRTGAGLPTDRPLTIGIAFASLTDGYPFFRPMLEGMRSEADRPVAVRLFDMPASDLPSGSLDHAPSLDGLDGVVMMSPVNLQLVARCQQKRLPCVLLYTDIADGYSRCVVVDYAAGLLQAARHLHEQGRKNVALVTAGNDRFSTGQITDAFAAGRDLFGFNPREDYIIHAGYEEKDGHRAMQALLKLRPRPNAVLLASDYQARGALLAMHETKLRAPTDISIIGAGNLLHGTGWPVPLTTIDLRFEEVGRIARQLIESQRSGIDASNTPYRTSVRSALILGQTA